VAFISYFIILSIIGSIIQQIHDYVFWQDIISEQFASKMKNPTNPELAIANGSTGMDLALYYIRTSVCWPPGPSPSVGLAPRSLLRGN
jgi:hypothetical protein